MCSLQNTHGTAQSGGPGAKFERRDQLLQKPERAATAPSCTAVRLSCMVCKGYCSAAKHSEQTLARIVGQQVPQFNSVLCKSVLPFAYFKFFYLVIALGSLLQEQRRALGEAVIFYSCFPHNI